MTQKHSKGALRVAERWLGDTLAILGETARREAIDTVAAWVDREMGLEGINPEAVPEIITALELAIEWHDLIRQDYPDMAGLVRALSDGRAALAKAKGETACHSE